MRIFGGKYVFGGALTRFMLSNQIVQRIWGKIMDSSKAKFVLKHSKLARNIMTSTRVELRAIIMTIMTIKMTLNFQKI